MLKHMKSFTAAAIALGILAGPALFTAAARADLTDPLYKILPSDGETTDVFGNAVAISGTIAIVAAENDNDNGSNSGSAYLFDVTTGAQLAKLMASDGAANDYFGTSVAISGTRAIVGANWDDDNGSKSGSAYVFDTTSGAQLVKLLPNDGQSADEFGYSVAIDGTIAIVGAPYDDDTTLNAGSAYVFDVTTGQQLFKLLADDGSIGSGFGWSVGISGTTAIIGAPGPGKAYLFDVTTGAQLSSFTSNDYSLSDGFGWAVAISGTRAVIGSPRDDDLGADSGSAYIFDATTGQQLDKLLPSVGAPFGSFGYAVSISGTSILVGSWEGDYSGAAYLFDATTGTEIARLQPEDTVAQDIFAYSVGISGTRAIAGARQDDDNGDNSGSAYVTATDTDRDGLLDSWETFGIDANGDGTVDLDLPALGANPNHKDLFIEVDSMVGRSFHPTARANVIQAFADAPHTLVDNPDGQDGINLHIIVDEENLPLAAFPNRWSDYDPIKSDHFGTPAERNDANWDNIKAAKMKAFRYCIFAQSHGTTSSSGLAELRGNDFMVTLGLWSTPGGTVDQQAGTFMHELGHTLGLRHGGGDDIHRKPNYYSVMNYTWQFPKALYAEFWRLDYSRVELDSLNEAALDESAGIDSSDANYLFTPFGIGGEPPQISWAVVNGDPVDWNNNGSIDAGTVAVDINYHFQCGSPASPCPSPGEVLDGHDDWSNLHYALFGGPNFQDGVRDETSVDTEMTYEIFQQMNAIPSPPGVCVADLDGSGDVDVVDLLQLLAAWGECGGCPEDLDLDDAVNVLDLLQLLAAWGPC